MVIFSSQMPCEGCMQNLCKEEWHVPKSFIQATKEAHLKMKIISAPMSRPIPHSLCWTGTCQICQM